MKRLVLLASSIMLAAAPSLLAENNSLKTCIYMPNGCNTNGCVVLVNPTVEGYRSYRIVGAVGTRKCVSAGFDNCRLQGYQVNCGFKEWHFSADCSDLIPAQRIDNTVEKCFAVYADGNPP